VSRRLLVALLLAGCGREPDAFDLDRLHEITIEVAPADLAQLDNDANNQRVPCTFIFDGVRLEKVGIRRKGTIGSVAKVAQKSGYSLRFDEFVPGQRLHDLTRLTLNNAKQDGSFLNEHLGYEIARRAGLPAPRTAHARLSLNGTSYGLYVVKETIEKQFLARVFGDGQGNLYEGTYPVDFVTAPDQMDLKDELDDHRQRDDLRALAAAVATPVDAGWPDRVGRLLDLDAFITISAVEIVVHHWDGYSFNVNNYYLYDDPRRGKFVMLPHGMDQLFAQTAFSPDAPTKGALAQRLRQVPALADRLHAEVARVARVGLDLPALDARMDRLATLLATLPSPDPRLASDLQRFTTNLPPKHAALATRKSKLLP
jgi:spore coat protein H